MDLDTLRGALVHTPSDQVAAAMHSMTIEVVQTVRNEMGWRKQLPLQLGILIAGLLLGYLLGVWDPLR